MSLYLLWGIILWAHWPCKILGGWNVSQHPWPLLSHTFLFFSFTLSSCFLGLGALPLMGMSFWQVWVEGPKRSFFFFLMDLRSTTAGNWSVNRIKWGISLEEVVWCGGENRFESDLLGLNVSWGSYFTFL